MIVQIFEPFEGGGHPTTYIRNLLPPLIRLLHRGLIHKVVVTISREHYESIAYADQLSPFASDVQFDPSLGVVWGMTKSVELAREMIRSVLNHKSDYLIVTTADLISVGLGAMKFLGQGIPRDVYSVGVFHKGYELMGENLAATSFRRRLRDEIFRFGRDNSRWSEMLAVNPRDYERLASHKRIASRWRMLPDPIARVATIDKREARTKLGLPLDGRYIGCIGMNDNRKAIPELLAAFRVASDHLTDRILLAGRLEKKYESLVTREYSDLVDNGRLRVVDRYLDEEEFRLYISAIDVAAVTYYPGTGLSANLLNAACAGRPVLAGSSGFSRMAVETFDLGWTTDVRDALEFASTIKVALRDCDKYKTGEKQLRLTRFHEPSNFENCILGNLYMKVGLESPVVPTWEWATQNSILQTGVVAEAFG